MTQSTAPHDSGIYARPNRLRRLAMGVSVIVGSALSGTAHVTKAGVPQ
jgi:hypothetical protein